MHKTCLKRVGLEKFKNQHTVGVQNIFSIKVGEILRVGFRDLASDPSACLFGRVQVI